MALAFAYAEHLPDGKVGAFRVDGRVPAVELVEGEADILGIVDDAKANFSRHDGVESSTALFYAR